MYESAFSFIYGDYQINERDYLRVTEKTNLEIIYTLYKFEGVFKPQVIENQSSSIILCQETMQEYIEVNGIRVNAKNVYFGQVNMLEAF